MILSLALALALADGQDQVYFPTTRPVWAVAHWATEDAFAGAWSEYAAELKKNPGYVQNSEWPEKARVAIMSLSEHPNAKALYDAAADYLVARDLDWRFDLDRPPASLEHRTSPSALGNKLYRAWMPFSGAKGSKEFCRLGFAICAPRSDFDAGDLPRALAASFPDDRLVISALVWYERERIGGHHDLVQSTWILERAKRLPSLLGARPQDYITLATAYGVHGWSTHDVKDAIGYRDAFLEFKKRAPPEFAKRADAELKGVESYIKKHGGTP